MKKSPLNILIGKTYRTLPNFTSGSRKISNSLSSAQSLTFNVVLGLKLLRIFGMFVLYLRFRLEFCLPGGGYYQRYSHKNITNKACYN